MSPALQVRQRRAASLRLAPLPCGRRDPLDVLGSGGPSTFGLSGEELAAEAYRCRRAGWAGWEIGRRMARAERKSRT